MKHNEKKEQHLSLFLEVCSQNEELRLPLHTSIVMFLLSYCECKSFKVFMVYTSSCSDAFRSQLPVPVGVSWVQLEDLPQLVRSCRLPAAVDESGRLCRAGLAVVLRHIIIKTTEEDPSRKDVLELLGFKKTCLKACAEVSKWTRLCEIGIPSAVEEHLLNPTNQVNRLPPSILTLEQRLAEPVKVHNDDKIRRQKLQEQRLRENEEKQICEASLGPSSQTSDGLELRAALAKLSVDSAPAAATRGSSEIRKVKTTALPPLEHVFAEGLYFTLTDVVLLPCIHQYLGEQSPFRFIQAEGRESRRLLAISLCTRWLTPVVCSLLAGTDNSVWEACTIQMYSAEIHPLLNTAVKGFTMAEQIRTLGKCGKLK